MVEFVFTIDYEIYGNGQGSLTELVLEPAERLISSFEQWRTRFVVFPDVTEIERIDAAGHDPAIEAVKEQLKRLYKAGHEIGLHLHPWWASAVMENGRWEFDFSEYNLCTLPSVRMQELLDFAISYLRKILSAPEYTPVSFRAGHLLFQPTQPLGRELAARGVRIDSSAFPGGRWRERGIDYRGAPRTRPFWRFTDDVARPDPAGQLVEVPIHTNLEPVWKLLTRRRIGQQTSGPGMAQAGKRILRRLRDLMRLRYPIKFDLGQMTKEEAIHRLDRIIHEDIRKPSSFRPIVAILHTKDRPDPEIVPALLNDLSARGIRVSILRDVLSRIDANAFERISC
jgi:hypothetical protein